MIRHINTIKERIGEITSIRKEEVITDTTDEMIEILNFKDFLASQVDEFDYDPPLSDDVTTH